MKGSGKPDDRKGHVRFDVAGAGDGFTVRLVRHRQTKETVTDRHHLRNTAPVLDPTHNVVMQDPTPDIDPRYYFACQRSRRPCLDPGSVEK
jgi:hypothetical protein